MPPLLSVIIPTFRRGPCVVQTLRALLDQDYPRFEIVLADQNRRWAPDVAAELEALRADPRFRWIHVETLGLSAPRNEGVRQSRGEILVFVDDDVAIPDRSFLSHHARNYRDPAIAGVCGRELSAAQQHLGGRADPEDLAALDAPRWSSVSPLEQLLWFDRSSDRRVAVCSVSTCNASFRREVFYALGGFDENFAGVGYCDDYDLVLRLVLAGHTMVFDPHAWLVHLKSDIGGCRLSDRTNPFSEADRLLSTMVFFFRHIPRPMWGSFLYHYVLRKGILLRRNIVEPWRQPAVWWGTLVAAVRGRRSAALPHRSRIGGASPPPSSQAPAAHAR